MLTLAFLQACGTREGVRTSLPSTEFPAMERGATVAVAARGEGLLELSFDEEAQAKAKQELFEALEERGFQVSEDAEEADYILTFVSFTQEERDMVEATMPEREIVPRKRGIARPTGSYLADEPEGDVYVSDRPGRVVVGDTERVFLLDVVDADSAEFVWRGYTLRERGDLGEQMLQEEIGLIVSALPLAEEGE